MSGWVTVTGPPFSICERKIGTTDPGGAEHVAEAHRDEPRRRVALARGGDDPLGHRLGGAHDGLRVHGLVGRDQDEAARARGGGRLGRDLGRDRVVANGLERVHLHQADVLVGGGVKDDVRVEAAHDLEHAVRFLAVGKDRLAAGEVPLLGQLALDLEEVVLGVVEQDEELGRPGRSGDTARRRSSRPRR